MYDTYLLPFVNCHLLLVLMYCPARYGLATSLFFKMSVQIHTV